MWYFIYLIAAIFVKLACKTIFTHCKRLSGRKDKLTGRGFFIQNLCFNEKDTALFIIYLAFMGTLPGVLPFGIRLGLRISKGSSTFISVLEFLENNPDQTTVVVAVCVTFVYVIWMVITFGVKSSPEERAQAIRVINEQLGYSLDSNWFRDCAQKGVKLLGRKYDREINFSFPDLELALACLKGDSSVRKVLKPLVVNLFKEYRNHITSINNTSFNSQLIQDNMAQIAAEFDSCEVSCPNVQAIEQSLDTIGKYVSGWIYGADEEPGHRDDYYRINPFLEELWNVKGELAKPWVRNLPYHAIVIFGQGGVGKSHLIGDIVSHRISSNDPTILCLGQMMKGNCCPIQQLMEYLSIPGSKDVFLKKLNEFGKQSGKRVVVFIDGINEGSGKELWPDYVDSVIQNFHQYEHLLLVLSVRTTSHTSWFDDFVERDDIGKYEHKGFQGNTNSACEYMFNAYDIPYPSWPTIGDEFSNPLMLRLYCRSQELSCSGTFSRNRLNAIRNYITAFEHSLATKLGYDEAFGLVDKSLKSIAHAMVDSGSFYSIPFEDAQRIVSEISSSCYIESNLLDNLLEEGLLSKFQFSTGENQVAFGYESIGNYLTSVDLVETVDVKKWPKSLYSPETLSVVYPEIKHRELFQDYRSKYYDNFYLLKESMRYRDEVTEVGLEVVQNEINANNWARVFELLAICSCSNCELNANYLSSLLMPLSMVSRDSIWTINISVEHNELHSLLLELINWCNNSSDAMIDALDDSYSKLMAETIIWCLSSTNGEFRDKATKALVALLTDKQHILYNCIKKFASVSDPYIQERLFAVAFGCCVKNTGRDYCEHIADITNETVFNQKAVIDNILVRDFARSIIEYAVCRGAHIIYDRITAPYNQEREDPIWPTTDWIVSQYVKDVSEYDSDEEYIAVDNILVSMTTEHSSRGMYGDFGRYVFDHNVRNFPIDSELLSNWVIKRIFEVYQYNPKAFAKYDSKHRCFERAGNSVERIGKKYQWIAMHELMAILTDIFPSEPAKEEYEDPAYIKARTIDPTLTINELDNTQRYLDGFRYQLPQYSIRRIKNDTRWMYAPQDMPSIKNILVLKDENGNEWVNLHSYNTFDETESKPLLSDSINRELWLFIQSCTIDKISLKSACKQIRKYGLRGRAFPENSSIYYLYAREFYWSSVFKTQIEDAGYTRKPFQLDWKSSDCDFYFEPCYLEYLLESCSDKSTPETKSILLPSPALFRNLHMANGKIFGLWNDSTNNLICFDYGYLKGQKSALFIRQDALLEYLAKERKVILWPILIERTLNMGTTGYYPRAQVGGYVWMDSSGKMHQMFRLYDKNPKLLSQKVKKRIEAYKKKKRKEKLDECYPFNIIKIDE